MYVTPNLPDEQDYMCCATESYVLPDEQDYMCSATESYVR